MLFNTGSFANELAEPCLVRESRRVAQMINFGSTIAVLIASLLMIKTLYPASFMH
ncbi:hypothetical protein [Sulfuriferula thiophila]|uniref:hypothetical protein n=1 Tax=Sulfuriferula thiophila TaxID=1781211 RepID=UPI001677C047|nr:hypothetical protein [Sulfuriferula thiophila]